MKILEQCLFPEFDRSKNTNAPIYLAGGSIKAFLPDDS
jgi:hypothetical protein